MPHKWVADCRKRAELNPLLIQTDNRAPDNHTSVRPNGYPSDLSSGPPRPGSGQARSHITRLQRAGTVLIAGACIFAAVWYVPGIVAADGRSLVGTVTSNGILY